MEEFIVNGDEVESLRRLAERYNAVRAEIAQRSVGQDEAVESILISIFSRGHD